MIFDVESLQAVNDKAPYGVGQITSWPRLGGEPEGIDQLAVEELIEAWLSPERPFWAINQLHEISYGKPDVAWRIVCHAIETAKTDDDIGDIGAGPLEDFIQAFADSYISEIEVLAHKNPKFAKALQIVWFDGSDNTTSQRLRLLGCLDCNAKSTNKVNFQGAPLQEP